MIFGEHFSIKLTSVAPTTDSLYTPVVKDGGSPVSSAESFIIHTHFSKLLPKVNHHGICIHTGGNNECRDAFTRITGKEIRSDTLLVVILQEVEHLFLYSIQKCVMAVADSYPQATFLKVSYNPTLSYK